MYKNYVFNLYGTLIDIKTNEDNDELWGKLAIYMGYSGAHYHRDELKDAFNGTVKKLMSKNDQYECPDYRIQDVFYKLYKDKGVKPKKKAKFAAKTFRLLSTEYIRPYTGVVDILEELKENKKNIYVLSNAQKAFANSEMKFMGIKKIFDGICISSDVGVRKPDEKFYEFFMNKYQIKKKETLFIGNDAVDLKWAKEMGMDCVYVHTNLSQGNPEDVDAKVKILDGDMSKLKEIM